MSESVVFDGGTESDRKRLLELHRAYLNANGTLDTEALRRIWSDDLTNVFFNLNNHTYVGLEQWTRLWDYYRAQFETVEPWISNDVKVIIRGDMAVISCHRVSRLRWIGNEPPASFSDRPLPSRSTEVFIREKGDWKVVHVHFSPASEGPRPGNI